MLPNLLIDKKTGKIISFGFTKFQSEENQEVVQSPVEQLPDDINKCFYKDGKIIVDEDYSNKQKRKQEILTELEELDKKKVRALADAVLFENVEYLKKYEDKAQTLRRELQILLGRKELKHERNNITDLSVS